MNATAGGPAGPLVPSALLEGVLALPIGARLGAYAAYTFLAAAYLGALGGARLGAPRLLLALPVVLLNLAVPLAFDRVREVVALAYVAFIAVWLCNFRVVSWCLNRGPLRDPLSLAQRFCVMLLPMTPAQAGGGGSGKDAGVGPKAAGAKTNSRLAELGGDYTELAGGFLAKGAALGAIIAAVTRPGLPVFVAEYLLTLGLYCFLGLMNDGPSSLLGASIGLRIAPHFDHPWMSSSVSNFWSHRWNLTAGFTLRCLIYDPIVEGRLVRDPARPCAKPPKALRAAAVCASFLVSGLIHEAVMWYLAGRMPGKWLAFFSLQGPLCALESELRGWARGRGVRVPRWAAILATNALLLGLGHLYFFPPCSETGLTGRLIGNLQEGYARLARGAFRPGVLGLVSPGKGEL